MGICPDEGLARDPLVVRPVFEHDPVVVHEVAVIGGKDDDNIAADTTLAEMDERARDGIVDAAGHAVCQGVDLPFFL